MSEANDSWLGLPLLTLESFMIADKITVCVHCGQFIGPICNMHATSPPPVQTHPAYMQLHNLFWGGEGNYAVLAPI